MRSWVISICMGPGPRWAEKGVPHYLVCDESIEVLKSCLFILVLLTE